MTEAVFKPIQLRIIALMIIMPYCMMAYPVFGMKRYGRSSSHPQNGWAMSSVMHRPSYYYQALPRPQTYHPFSYYDALNLYAPEYDDYYYSQDAMAYPLYYPTFSRGGSNNYDFYQPVVPYYYTNPYSYYDSSDPMEDLQEEVLQEEEREQREEGYPIGQETWYEPDGTESQDTDSMDDVNAAFMKNLMLYNKAMTHPNYVYGKIQPEDAYSQYTDLDNWNTNPYNYEDKDEQELKMLNEAPKKQKSKNNKKQSTAEERMQMFEKNNNRNQKNRYNPNNSESWMNYGNKRTSRPDGGVKTIKYDTSFTSRKPQKVMTINKVSSSSTVSPVSTQTAFNDPRGGQKEVVMIRPATPVRRPFSEPVMQLLAKQGGPERKRTPSVYDTIKHMLEMEKNLEKEYRTQDYFRPAMRKRYVSSEESLVEELSGLKKTAVVDPRLYEPIARESKHDAPTSSTPQVPQAKTKWKRLRETFSKKLSSMPEKKSGDAGGKTEECDWPYFKSLMFLKDQFEARSSSGNFSTNIQKDCTETVESEVSDQDNLDEELLEISKVIPEKDLCSPVLSVASTSSAKKYKCNSPTLSTASSRSSKRQNRKTSRNTLGETYLKAEQEKLEYLKKKTEQKVQKKTLDEDEAFFESILPHVRKLTTKQKMKFRIRVLQLLDDDIPNPNSSTMFDKVLSVETFPVQNTLAYDNDYGMRLDEADYTNL